MQDVIRQPCKDAPSVARGILGIGFGVLLVRSCLELRTNGYKYNFTGNMEFNEEMKGW